jgi:hypothetical protein
LVRVLGFGRMVGGMGGVLSYRREVGMGREAKRGVPDGVAIGWTLLSMRTPQVGSRVVAMATMGSAMKPLAPYLHGARSGVQNGWCGQ